MHVNDIISAAAVRYFYSDRRSLFRHKRINTSKQQIVNACKVPDIRYVKRLASRNQIKVPRKYEQRK